MQLQSFVAGKWWAGAGNGVALRDATTGEVIANATADGLDSRAMLAHASEGTRELPDSRVYVDGGVEALSKTGTFVGQHICVPLEGAAVHINAFNFPVWGMLEKLAPTLLAGVPAIVKP